MIFINFGHPLTDSQREKILELTDQAVDRKISVKVQFDQEKDFISQLHDLISSIGLTSEEWQTQGILINPPTHNLIAILLIAELHGRIGYFPSVVRLRPILNSAIPEFEVVEIINLQYLRETTRKFR